MLMSLVRSWATTLNRNPRRFSTAATMARDYNAAVTALNTLQSNFSIVDAIRKSGRGMNTAAIPEMIEWFRKAGYEPSDFDRLKPIHIAGTKGKGSTSAFVSSILAQYQTAPSPAPRKIGLYTSPHLKSVRERIQINNTPLSEEAFARYFFEIWDRLEEAARKEGQDPAAPGAKPVYFRFLTIMALHAYLREGVDAAIIECGIGGEHDSTNVIVHPTVAAVTSLGIDHVAMLGNTLPEIAWHKAGIFKPGAAALSVPQASPEAMHVLRQRAAEKNAELVEIARHPDIDSIKLGLAADFQRTNASLAIAIAASHLRALGDTSIPAIKDLGNWTLPAEFRRGLEQVRWPGRCEIRREERIAWHIDGAHTLDSIEVVGRWFADEIASSSASSSTSTPGSSPEPRILIFNQQTRDAASLARALHAALSTGLSAQRPFTHAVFTTNLTFQETGYKPDLVSVNTNSDDVEKLAVQRALAQTWREIDPQTEVEVVRTIEEAVTYARNVARSDIAEGGEMKVLITGSLHLVGGALEVLDSK